MTLPVATTLPSAMTLPVATTLPAATMLPVAMTLPVASLCLLALAALLALGRLCWLTRARPALRNRRWWLLLALQPMLAAGLYLALFPPPRTQAAQRIVIATAGATPAQVAALGKDAIVLALPEAGLLPGVARAPDLGTIARRYPAADLQVVGIGLVARDRDAVRDRAVGFSPTALPSGLVELHAPTRVTVGNRWQASGRVNAVAGGSVQLRDPAGNRVDRATIDATGNFTVHGQARAPGRFDHGLQLRDARGRLLQAQTLPMTAVDGAAPRVLVLAGGPGPELKYLRRWASDAGVSLRTQISVGAGLQLGDAPLPFNAATLAGFDLLIVDERAWRALGAASKGAVGDALRGGLGVLLRVTGPLSAAERQQWRNLGADLQATQVSRTASLSATATGGTALPLSRHPWRPAGRDAVVLLRDGQGEPLAAWWSQGRGRIAAWWLSDTHRLVLAGHGQAHGRLWSQALAQLARGRAQAAPRLMQDDLRPNQRAVACGLSASASLQSPRMARVPLLIETDTRAGRCASFWPREPGWHRLDSGAASLSFMVRAASEAPGIAARIDQEQTAALQASYSTSNTPAVKLEVPGRRLPWFLAWLVLAAAAWWLERRWFAQVPSR